MYIPNTVNK